MSNELLGGPAAQAIGWSLLHLVWEAALVGGIVAAVLALMSRRTANARYLVSCAALALLPFLAVVTALRSYDAPITPSASLASAPAVERAAVSSVATSINFFVGSSDSPSTTFQSLAARAAGWLPQIVMIWLAGVTFFSIRLLVSWTRVRQLARQSSQPASASWQRVTSRLSDALRLQRAIALIESAAVEVPTVIGWLRPIILLPAATLSGLTPEQIEMVLAHELAHIRRHDFFVNLLQTVVETLMFYHPAVWWISRRIRIEREHCCDDLAIAVCGNPLQYARALTRLEELRAAQTALAVAANGGSLMTRIRRLVVAQKESTSASTRWAAGAAVLAVVALLLTLPTLPALANHESDEKPAVQCAKTAKTTVDVHGERKEIDTDDNNETTEVDVDSDNESDQASVPAVEVAPAPATTPAPSPEYVPAIAVSVPALSVAPPAIATRVSPRAMALAQVATVAPRAPMARMRLRDDKEFGENGKLTVDELIELRSAGVTPEYINDMRANSGFPNLSLRDLFELRSQGVTPEYLKQIRASGLGIKTAREAVELKAMGVSSDYIAAMAKTGYPNLGAHDLIELRSQGVTPAYIAELSGLGYKNLSVHEVVTLRAMGVSTAFVKALADAGYSNLSADELVRLAASGVNADFIREMAQYRKK